MMKDGYKVLALFDPHIQTLPNGRGGWKPHIAKSLYTALEFGKWWKPDETIMGQDWMEFAPISFWNRHKKLEMEGRRLAHDFELANKVMDTICDFTESKIMFIPGNHDFWMDNYINENPALEGLLNEGKQLGFKERGVESLEYGKVYRLGKAAFCHEFLQARTKSTKYHSAKMAEDYGKSIFYGHWHTHQAYTKVTYDSQPYAAVSIGCLSNLNPGWLRNGPNNWVNQLLFLEFDSQGRFTYYAPILIKGTFMYGGRIFGANKDPETNEKLIRL